VERRRVVQVPGSSVDPLLIELRDNSSNVAKMKLV
jgi:hypothetical protein